MLDSATSEIRTNACHAGGVAVPTLARTWNRELTYAHLLVRWLAILRSRVVVKHCHRSATRQLAALDDRMLADIGLRRCDIVWAARCGRES
jgi:uncharacterized protein YjiS (DUF1127 family)